MVQVPTYALTAALSGLATRQQIGAILAALQSLNSGTTAPQNPVAGMWWLDTSTNPDTLRIRNDANSAWVVFAPADGSITNLKLANVASGVMKGRSSAGTGAVEDLTPAQARLLMEVDPVGEVAFFAMQTAPTGWLKANGALVSRTTYAALFAAIGTAFGAGNGTTTFALPDLRGEFLRGWDDGRVVDSGRAFGSAQTDAMLNHTHSGTTSTNGDHTHTIQRDVSSGFLANSIRGDQGVSNYQPFQTGAAGSHNHTLTTGNPSVGGGTETRPRNIALLACIKF